MASKPITNATQDIDLGDSAVGDVSTKVIAITFGTLVGSIVVKGRLQGRSSATFVPIPYRRRYLNGAVGDENFGAAAITGDSIIEVNANGIEIRLSYTHTSGNGPGAYDYVDLTG